MAKLASVYLAIVSMIVTSLSQLMIPHYEVFLLEWLSRFQF